MFNPQDSCPINCTRPLLLTRYLFFPRLLLPLYLLPLLAQDVLLKLLMIVQPTLQLTLGIWQQVA